MAIELNPKAPSAAAESITTPAPAPTPRATDRPAKPAANPFPEASTKAAEPPAGTLQANVTFRRDTSGQIYYVLTDAQSGKEIREVPPAEIRKVGEGIESFLKQEEAKATPKLDSKA
jgi:hypothetical protein